MRQAQEAIPGGDRPAPVGRPAGRVGHPLLSLQASAGNRAVTRALRSGTPALTHLGGPGPEVVQRQEVGPKAPVKLSGKAGDFQTFIDGGGPFVFTMYVLNDDMIGHAWVGVRRGDGKSKTAGFWPGSIWSGIVGPGLLMTPDGHEGGQSGATDFPVADITQMYRILSVIGDWDGALYSLLFHNCAHFVVDAWKTVTGQDVFPGKNEDLMVDMWSPLMIGMAVDERNKKKAELDRARTGQTDGGGGSDTRTAGDTSAPASAGDAGQPADGSNVGQPADGDLVPA